MKLETKDKPVTKKTFKKRKKKPGNPSFNCRKKRQKGKTKNSYERNISTLTEGDSEDPHKQKDLPIVSIVDEEEKEDDSDIDHYNRDTKSETTTEQDVLRFHNKREENQMLVEADEEEEKSMMLEDFNQVRNF